jgi:hypothetical protein
MEHYIPPLLVEKLPPGKTATDVVEELERRGIIPEFMYAGSGLLTSSTSAVPNAGVGVGVGAGVTVRAATFVDSELGSQWPQPQPLSELEESLLSGAAPSQAVVVTGEGGTGKTTFLLRLAERIANQVWAHLHRRASDAVPAPWTPVVLELRRYSSATLHGALPRYLMEVCGLPCEVVTALQEGDVPKCGAGVPLVRLLVLCDGTDEMVDGGDGKGVLRDFVATLCGGTAWSPSTLRVVVTSRRDGHVPGCPHRVLLPFGKAQVW